MALSATTTTRIVWAVRLFLALAFGAAGAAKLAGVPQMVQIFDHIGIGQWFRCVTGIVAGTWLVPFSTFVYDCGTSRVISSLFSFLQIL